jgi:hypothetical protein
MKSNFQIFFKKVTKTANKNPPFRGGKMKKGNRHRKSVQVAKRLTS